MEYKFAIIVVGYNRIHSIKRLFTSLNQAYYPQNVDLIISLDKYKTNEVEKYAETLAWKFGNLIIDKHTSNLGLRAHMMSLGKWFEIYDALIVLEDDIVVIEDFFNFTIQCYNKYKDDNRIAGIGLYSYNLNYQNCIPFYPLKGVHDIYMFQCAMSWGQVWLKKQWIQFYNWYLKHQEFTFCEDIPLIITKWPKSSWLKYHIRYCIECNKYFIYPYYSLSTNFTDIGTHNKGLFNHSLFQVQIQKGIRIQYRLPSFEECEIKYDAFYNNIGIYSALKLNPNECLLDLYGEIDTFRNKRYYLSTKLINYKIVESFALDYRPIEVNIFLKQKGNGIYLYDLSTPQKNNVGDNLQPILYQYYMKDLFSLMKVCGVFRYILSPIATIWHKLKSKL